MSTKDTSSNTIATIYLGIALIVAIVGFVIFAVASLGYNSRLSLSHEKIEVQTTNSNSQNKTDEK